MSERGGGSAALSSGERAPPYERRISRVNLTRREADVAIAMLVDNPEGSQEIYEKVRAHLRLEGPAGGIFHAAGPSPNGGWRVLEVWESEEDARRFRDERLMPAFDAAGVPRPPGPPEVWQLHDYMK
jgi:hypothetical protein